MMLFNIIPNSYWYFHVGNVKFFPVMFAVIEIRNHPKRLTAILSV